MKATKYFEPKNDKMERGPQRSMCINFDRPLVLDWDFPRFDFQVYFPTMHPMQTPSTTFINFNKSITKLLIHHKLSILWLRNGNCAKFVHSNLYVSWINIMHWKHVSHTNLLKDVKAMHDICSFIGWYFIRQHIYPCVKRVFNA